MSSLNITVEIKAPRSRLIKTHKIKARSCLWQSASAPVMSATIVWAASRQDLHPGARLTHITSRRVLIFASDNNYQEEYTQNDFFCDFYASPTQGRGDNGIRGKGASRKTLPGAGSSIKFALPLRCRGTSGKKAGEPFI